MPLNTKHNYSAEEMVKIAGAKATFITEDEAREILADDNLKYSVRMFGLFEDGRQIVKINTGSIDRLNVSAIWISGTTISDLIGRK
jgi:hypothetical protein